MPTFQAEQLKQIAGQIFVAAGAVCDEARVVSEALVEANLAGHDSHGILRIPEYVRWMEHKQVTVGAHIKIVHDSDSFAIVDGGWGFGQVVAAEAMDVAIAKAEQVGVATVAASRCCHIGRVGDYPARAAARGMAAVMFVNTHGGGKLVAPWGGKDRRLSANPISIAIPRTAGNPIVVDISTSAIAEGKVRGMLNQGIPVPPGCLLDAEGHPTTDASRFYGPPQGALLPFGGHKGYALGLVTDILAGAFSGGGCSRKDADRVGNTFLAFVLDVGRLRGEQAFHADVEQLIEYVRSSSLAPGSNGIVIPGEPEASERERRLQNGVTVDEKTWHQVKQVASRYGVDVPQ